MAARIKRGYSREFRAHGDTGKNYLLYKVPAGMFAAARARGKREGHSTRAMILHLIKLYADGAVEIPAANTEA